MHAGTMYMYVSMQLSIATYYCLCACMLQSTIFIHALISLFAINKGGAVKGPAIDWHLGPADPYMCASSLKSCEREILPWKQDYLE